MVNKLVLHNLVKDVEEEKILWNHNLPRTASEEDRAWERIAEKNAVAAKEAKSIFKVLYKKYQTEKKKEATSWQLFKDLKYLDGSIKNCEPPPLALVEKPPTVESTNNQIKKIKVPLNSYEEEIFVELLEVKEEEFSDDEYETKSNGIEKNKAIKSEITATQPVEGETKSKLLNKKVISSASSLVCSKTTPPRPENQQQSNNIQAQNKSLVTIATIKESNSLQKKTIKRKYTSPLSSPLPDLNIQNNSMDLKDPDEHEPNDKRRVLLKNALFNSKSSPQSYQKNKNDSNDTTTTVSTLTNEEKKSFQKDAKESSSSVSSSVTAVMPSSSSSLISSPAPLPPPPPSTANENTSNDQFACFGNYIANAMNRLQPKLATLLEIKILQAMIEVQTECIHDF